MSFDMFRPILEFWFIVSIAFILDWTINNL